MICAEGYLFELERRGYLQAGAFVPEVVLEEPEVVAQLHREFVRAGSDVVEAFTYYAHREKMRIVGKEHLLEEINRKALSIAKEVADETGTLLAGDICNTNVYVDDDEESRKTVRGMFEEQVCVGGRRGSRLRHRGDLLARRRGVDRARRHQASGLSGGRHADGAPVGGDEGRAPVRGGVQAAGSGGRRCRRPQLQSRACDDAAAAPRRSARRSRCTSQRFPCPTGRTRKSRPFSRCETRTVRSFPVGCRSRPRSTPSRATATRSREFARDANDLGVGYIGLCCGAAPHHLRSLAEALGRTPPASRFSPDMSKHAYFGTDESLKSENREFAKEL